MYIINKENIIKHSSDAEKGISLSGLSWRENSQLRGFFYCSPLANRQIFGKLRPAPAQPQAALANI